MAQNVAAVFEGKPIIGLVALTAASTPRDGTATIVTLVTGGTDGTRVDSIQFLSAQASAAANSVMVGRVFLSTDGGSTWFLFDEVAIPAATASNTVVGTKAVLNYSQGLNLYGTSMKIGVAISVRAGVQDNMHVTARGGDLTLA